MSLTLTIGQTQQMTVTLVDTFGVTMQGIGVPRWSSSNESVATVNSVGLVTTLAVGSAVITATLNGVSGSSTVSVIVDEVSYLRANIVGGDATILALYSVNYGVTLNGSTVSTWSDARGGGFGPDLTQATGSLQPAWDSVNSVITFDGVDDYLASAANSLFDLSAAKWLGIVFDYATNASNAYAVTIADSGAFNRLLAIPTLSDANGASIRGEIDAGINQRILDGNVPLVTGTRRLAIVSKDATTGINMEVPNHFRGSDNNVTGVASGNNILTVGAKFAGSLRANARLRAMIGGNRVPTAGDISTLMTWAATSHNATAAT